MRWTLLAAVALVGCRSAPHQDDPGQAAHSVSLDTVAIRRLCAQPDSVLAGQATCELREQGRRIKVF
jgi:hypothetical protein